MLHLPYHLLTTLIIEEEEEGAGEQQDQPIEVHLLVQTVSVGEPQ